MKKQKYIYVLVGFNFLYMKAKEKYRELEKRSSVIYKTRNDSEENQKIYESIKQEFKEFKNTKEYNYILMGSHNKGYFLTKKDAVNFIEKNGGNLHEGAYYTHFLIEKHGVGYEGYCFGDNAETWFRGESTGDGWWDYRYVPCEKPECFCGTISFA
jgi:hypothetical protein